MNDESANAENSSTLILLGNLLTKFAVLLAFCCAAGLLFGCSRQAVKRQSTPIAKPTVPCDRDATVLDRAQPEWPDEARTGRVHEAQVAIRVDISASGQLRRAKVVQSGGIPALDRSALLAADRSTYEPAVKHCKPIGGSYIFRVTFSANS